VLFGPFVGVVLAASRLLGSGATILDLALLVIFYVVSGHGMTAGFHRLLTHRSFTTHRWVKLALALAGSLAMQGSVTSWVANHRRHHVYADRDGDQHSPHRFGSSPTAALCGALHAHIGWLFQCQDGEEERWASDLRRDRDLVLVSRPFPVLCVVSLSAPTLIAWAFTGTAGGDIGGLTWGGLVRVFLLQHSTFAVNSACHLWGDRPFRTSDDDRATNLAPMAFLTMSGAWHNAHHAFPRSARHGVDHGQIDSTARLIWILEHLDLAWDVRWPDPDRLDAWRNTDDR
jgi:stearoyl-CoA desaturase (delta-9 desaturase)